ncbi:MAG: sirohydrochlorin cobaltochelatase [Hungatella sp.]|nr:sirohydrochlorin cobaltochelatase [Hungatella sp.]
MKRRASALLVAALAAAVLTACQGCGKVDVEQSAGAGDLGRETSRDTVTQPEEKGPSQVSGKKTKESTMEEHQNISDTAILVVSFGTSYNDSRDVTIGAVEEAIARACPQYEVRRAFTAQTIIDILKKRDGLEIDNVTEALDRAAADGIKNLVIQPTHLMDGFEYQDVMAELEEYRDLFDQILVGAPLLTGEEDFKAVAEAITADTRSFDDGETAIVFMGHGTEARSNQVYERMQTTLAEEGFDHYYVGTVEAEPALDDVARALEEKGTYKKVVLKPLMVVAGDHANNDMAGDEEDSWKTVLTQKGYEVECVLEGLGQSEAIRDIYVDHVLEAVGGLR